MKHLFIPRNYYEAFLFLLEVPFYGLVDCCQMRGLEFEDEEIRYIEDHTATKGHYRVFYVSRGFEGFVSCKGEIDNEKFRNKEIRINNTKLIDYVLEMIQLIFHRYSPPLWHIFTSLAVALVFWISRETGAIFPSFFNPRLVPNTYCDIDCMKNAWHYLFLLRFNLALSVFCILTCGYLFFFKSKKLRKAKYVRSMQASSFLLILINLVAGAGVVKEALAPKYKAVNLLIHKSDYVKDRNKRTITSEMDGVEFKKNPYKR